MNRHDPDLARRLLHKLQYVQPDTHLLISYLPDFGNYWSKAAVELARDCTVSRIDKMLARVESAKAMLLALRRSLNELEQV